MWKKLILKLRKIFITFYRNLDETTKSVYKDNVRLSEFLNYHMKESEMWKKLKLREIFITFYRNLDETTKSVYKENERLSEFLNYHMKQSEMWKKLIKRDFYYIL